MNRLEAQDFVGFVQNMSLPMVQVRFFCVEPTKAKGAHALVICIGLKILQSRSTDVLTFTLAAREVRRRNALEEVGSLTSQVFHIRFCDRAGRDIHHTRVSGTVVDFVDGVNG